MRNLAGLLLGAIAGVFITLLVAGLLGNAFSDRTLFMDGAPTWPFLIALPLGVLGGFLLGNAIAKRRPTDQ